MMKRLFILVIIFLFVSSASLLAQGSKEEEALFVAKRAFEDGFYDVSLTLFQRFLQKYPESYLKDEVKFYIGQCFFYQKKYSEALDVFRKLIDTENASISGDKLYYWVAEVYFKSNIFSHAYSFYEKLLSKYPNSTYRIHAFYSLGWCLFEQGKFQAARDKFIEFKNKFPHDPLAEEAAFKTAECIYNLKQYAELKGYLEYLNKEYPQNFKDQALKSGGKGSFLRFYLAESNFYTGDYANAIIDYTKALGSSSDKNLVSLSLLGLGWSYLKSGDYVNAKNSFEKVIQDAGDKRNTESALLGEAVVLQMSSMFKEAVNAYTKIIESQASTAIKEEAYLGKGESLYSLENYNESVFVYNEAKNKAGLNEKRALVDRLHYGLGLSYFKLGKYKESILEFSYILKNSDDSMIKASAGMRLADVFLETKEPKKTINIYGVILKYCPQSSICDRAQYNLAIVLLNLKLYSQAQDAFKNLILKYPNSQILEEAYFYLSTAYFESGDFLSSYLQARSFVSKYPQSSLKSRALILEALSLKSMKKFQDAYNIFKAVIKDYSGDIHAMAKAEFESTDCLYYLGQEEEAIRKFESLRSKYTDPEIAGSVLWRLSEYNYKKRNFDLCTRYLRDIIQGYPASSLVQDSHFLLGLCYMEENSYIQAIDALRKVVNKRKEAYLKIADAYRALGELKEAISYYRIALNKNSADRSLVRFRLADCLEEYGSIDEALMEYSLVTGDTSLMVKGMLRSAEIFEAQENWDSAIKFYEKIASLEVDEAKFAKEKIAYIKDKYLAKR